MSEPFLSEIRMMSFNYPPKGWALCNGQLLAINQNQAMFSLLGTTYGGDGRTNFGLPNLQARVPMHVGNGHVLGELSGEANHTLSVPEMPVHNHLPAAKAAPADTKATAIPPGPTVALAEPFAVLAGSPPTNSPVSIYSAASPTANLATSAIGMAGGSQSHPNQQPFLTISFCIALQGIFPSQN